MTHPPGLVLWDIDRTLLYCGQTDRLVYEELFTDFVGRPPQRLPAKGTGRTVPLALAELFSSNGVDPEAVPALVERAIEEVPRRQYIHRGHMLAHGHRIDGAQEALAAVARIGVVATVVTGNLQHSAELKLDTFELNTWVDTSVGGYSSDNPHRPALVEIARSRVNRLHGTDFTAATTVIIGDSVEDVTTGREGGARVLAVAAGTTPAATLRDAGADTVLADLTDEHAVVESVTALLMAH